MLRINQIKLKTGHPPEALEEKILDILRVPKKELKDWRIFRRSIDARKKPEIFYVYTVDVTLVREEAALKRLKGNAARVEENPYRAPSPGGHPLSAPPVIVGSGPAGLFCALLLSRAGYRPVLIERGAPLEERIQDVEAFWEKGILNPQSNVQFGEGGAGTFSDGKLNTLVKDRRGRNRFVLETFVKFGAPKEILYEQKPHIGTDLLVTVVRRMREEILNQGGSIRFHSQLTGLDVRRTLQAPRLCGITINGCEALETEALVLAIGHSARDTFQMLYETGLPMEAKSFAVGVRVQHPQSMIQISQYGEALAEALPAASYKLAEKLKNGRGVYTFCMCPGGYVVNASSEEGRLAVNGMSYHRRDAENANSAVIVTVTPEDFGNGHPLLGMEFQRRLEERAFQAGGGQVPVQCFKDFQEKKASTSLGEVRPCIKGAYRLADVRSIFPEILASSLEEGILAMDKKIPGFAREDALLSGAESRTSSPVRIMRNDQFESEIQGIYPCGEGAGYAGGIMSAAMDGMKTAEAMIQKYSRPL